MPRKRSLVSRAFHGSARKEHRAYRAENYNTTNAAPILPQPQSSVINQDEIKVQEPLGQTEDRIRKAEDEKRKAEDEKQHADELARIAEENRKKEEQARITEQKRRLEAEAQARIAEEKLTQEREYWRLESVERQLTLQYETTARDLVRQAVRNWLTPTIDTPKVHFILTESSSKQRKIIFNAILAEAQAEYFKLLKKDKQQAHKLEKIILKFEDSIPTLMANTNLVLISSNLLLEPLNVLTETKASVEQLLPLLDSLLSTRTKDSGAETNIQVPAIAPKPAIRFSSALSAPVKVDVTEASKTPSNAIGIDENEYVIVDRPSAAELRRQ